MTITPSSLPSAGGVAGPTDGPGGPGAAGISDVGAATSSWREFWRRYRKNKMAVVALVLLIVLIILAVFADQIAPYRFDERPLTKTTAPSWDHLFGTDQIGRDIFSRVIYGAR
ncbi:MAG: ABC transporter permease, partial [Acidimicrobiia bacterium]|nr:ABC transporter permease [Acidimicrobiia bacterium]